MALVTGILLLLLASSLLAGFMSATMSDARLRSVDRTRTTAFYAAHAGLEKLTSDLGNLFVSDFSPETSQIEELEKEPPVIDIDGDGVPDVVYVADDGLGYNIHWTDANNDGQPDTIEANVTNGPFVGFRGLITSYDLWVTARTRDGAEARMTRSMNTVSIPVFQFGIFSETDLTFSANATFNFGGRVHTNGNLFLTAATGGTTTLTDRVTVVEEVIRTHLANSRSVAGTHQGNVYVARSAGSTRKLEEDEGSVVGFVGSAQNEPKWTNLSIGTYNGYIRNGRTGAKRLELPLVTMGLQPIDLIRRGKPGEDPLLTSQRLFAQANIRILLSDNANDITDLPGVSSTAPIPLGDNAVPGLNQTGGANPHPFAVSEGNTSWGQRAPAGTPLIGGFLKVEYKNAAGNWNDVTLEWLQLGYTRRNLDRTQCDSPAYEPDPNAIIRFQRIRPTPSGASGSSSSNTSYCGLNSSSKYDAWPLVLYDIREAYNRDDLSTSATALQFAGIMHYVDLDIGNLRRWLEGALPGSGTQVVNENGYTVYFSDRRGNRDASGKETGEYGYEDFVNPGSSGGTPNGILDQGEDVNRDGVLQTYGGVPVSPTGGFSGWLAPFTASATPWTTLTNGSGNNTAANQAKSNPAIFFRRALKVSNGALGQLPPGLTVVAENPVYVEGNYNANSSGFGNGSQPAAIMADAITLLSNAWRDRNSFEDPNDPNSRKAADTWFRFAALAGKGLNWTQTGTPASFGTDGGVHNFLRLIESWNGPHLYYRGSLASFYYSRQAVGLFRCCTNVYHLPARTFSFDTNFTVPALLPPNTPMFRDVNTTAFRLITSRQQ